MGSVQITGVCLLLDLVADLCCIPGAVSAVFLEDDQDSLKEGGNEFQGETHPFKTQSGMDSVLRPRPGVQPKFSFLFQLHFIYIQMVL